MKRPPRLATLLITHLADNDPLAGDLCEEYQNGRSDAAVFAFAITVPLWAFVNLYVLDGTGNLDAALPHAVALLLFITGMLTGGIHVRAAH